LKSRAFFEHRLPVFLFIICAEDWEQREPSVRGAARVVGRKYDLYGHRDVLVVTNR